MADEVKRQKRKLTALLRAEFALQQRFEKVDFEMDVLEPELREFERNAACGELPQYGVK